MKRTFVFVLSLAQNHLIVSQLYQYHYVSEEKTWTEAQQYCSQKHTDLATVTNMKDMKRLISVSLGDIKEAWIGLYDQRNVNRAWCWSLPGVEFNKSETNWAADEPNNLGSEGPNCGIIWKNLSCNDRQYFLYRNSSKKYHLIQEKKTWTEAQSYCREKHTDLISGTKQLQDEEVKNETSSVGNNTYILIGLFREKWRWSDGSSFSFRNWTKGFDYQAEYKGQCATTVFGDGGRWKNENCNEKKPFICYDGEMF
uniref:C-type lectin domain-containing protein n=1 Tax=Xiphophorus maculatus TaxID=8083 RepID=A0A3B5Q8F1_XIPMA